MSCVEQESNGGRRFAHSLVIPKPFGMEWKGTSQMDWLGAKYLRNCVQRSGVRGQRGTVKKTLSTGASQGGTA